MVVALAHLLRYLAMAARLVDMEVAAARLLALRLQQVFADQEPVALLFLPTLLLLLL